jgi:hypothetical protein
VEQRRAQALIRQICVAQVKTPQKRIKNSSVDTTHGLVRPVFDL